MDVMIKQPNKIEEIYSKLTQEQVKIIEVIWQYYITHWEEKEFADRCISKLKLYKAVSNLGINSETLDKNIANFTGSILVENNEKNSNDPLYLLQYLGPFLTSDASKIKNLIIKCLQYFKDNMLNRGTTKVDLHQIHSALAFTDEDNRLLKVSLSVMGLHNLLSLQNEIVVFTGKSPTKLFETDSLEELFNTSLPNYDPNMPIDSLQQHFYLQDKGQVNLEQVGTKKKMFDQDKEDKGKKDISDKDIFEGFFATYTRVNPKQVGEGGNGFVYEVIDQKKNRFALKLFKTKGSSTEKKERFKNEIYFCLKNNHKNIIKIVDLGHKLLENEKWLFYVMPLYESTLRKLMTQGIEKETILGLFIQMLDGVNAAHKTDVWHRDLKPENILYGTVNKDLVIADFGIAHFAEEYLIAPVDTKTTDKVGNWAYSAPEQRALKGKVDHRADIFSLGLILNEMFTESIPQGVGYTTIGDIVPEYSYLDKIVEKMVQQSPEKRYQSLEEVKQEIFAKNGQQNSLTSNFEVGELRAINSNPISQQIVVNEVDLNKRFRAYHSVYTLESDPNAESITQIAWSPDGQLIAAGFNGNGVDCVWVWDVAKRRRFYILPMVGQAPTSLMWLPNCEFLVVGYSSGTIAVWEVMTERLYKKAKAHNKAITTVCLLENKDNLVSLENDGGIYFWNLSAETFEHSVWASKMSVAKYVPGKQAFVIAIGEQVKYIPMGGTPGYKIGIQSANVTSIACSSDGKEAAVGSEDGSIILWNLDPEKKRDYREIDKHKTKVMHIEYLKDENFVLSKSSDGLINIWNRNTEETIYKLENQPSFQHCIGVALHPTDSNVLALLKSPNVIEVVSINLLE